MKRFGRKDYRRARANRESRWRMDPHRRNGLRRQKIRKGCSCGTRPELCPLHVFGPRLETCRVGQPVFLGCTYRHTVTALMVIMNGPIRATLISCEERNNFEKRAPGLLRDIRKGYRRDIKKCHNTSQAMQDEDAAMGGASIWEGWQYYD